MKILASWFSWSLAKGLFLLWNVLLIPDTQAAGSTDDRELLVPTPTGLVSRQGDRSVVLHWDKDPLTPATGYYVYRATSRTGNSQRVTPQPLVLLSFADLDVTNGQPYFYRVTALNRARQESRPSDTVEVVPRDFADDNAFLDYVQQTAFDYFWYEANPANGLIRDRSTLTSPCSIAAVGFGLTALGIGVDHGWITRRQGRERALTTLRTFWNQPQGPERTGTIGYHGWFYHFLDMDTARRFTQFHTELSSIDTALFLAGALEAKQFFQENHADEAAIRALVDGLYQRVDWQWLTHTNSVLRMGWHPETGFIRATWVGYNEAMILYCLGLGATHHPLPASAWTEWTQGYQWRSHGGYSFVAFPPLFGHQYSHAWIDYRHLTDAYMKERGLTYFENSRRATLAQRAYCIENPARHAGYGPNVWGLAACDGPPPLNYAARGAPPPENDDGTIAPTAAGGSIPFTPEYSLAALRHFYHHFRERIWTGYGFRDAFNLRLNWWATDVLGIDQGPILIMIENYRTQRVWQRFMRNVEIQRGMQRAGFSEWLPQSSP